MIPVIFHPTAREEIKDAASYYENQRAGLGQEFTQPLNHYRMIID